MENPELRLSGLAVYSHLTNAWQPPVDVSKSNIHVNKIALITIVNEVDCPLQNLAVNAQDAGYSVVIYFTDSLQPSSDNGTQNDSQDKLLIPVLHTDECEEVSPNMTYQGPTVDDHILVDADRSNVEISITQNTDDLKRMQTYLERLYYWFLLSPVITFEWLRRTKKFCCMSGGQQFNEDERSTEDEVTVGETGLHAVVVETQENFDQETEQEQSRGEEQPLIIAVNDPRANRTTMGHTGCLAKRRIFGKIAVGCGYVILIVAALPVGISSGGWSFFRFDVSEDVQQKSFLDGLSKCDVYIYSDVRMIFCFKGQKVLLLWWPSLQIFCFYLYSRFACKATWTVPTNFSKLIRSDWFASNMYLFILGVVVPYCSFDQVSGLMLEKFIYFTTYNSICTICNLLFIIILNKHKFVTRYVFYISVCMVCAYVESDIVAVFYFMLNSKGSLINLKITALRTVAIGLTLTLSLSSSMHIIRKLNKPEESLFEGLSEK